MTGEHDSHRGAPTATATTKGRQRDRLQRAADNRRIFSAAARATGQERDELLEEATILNLDVARAVARRFQRRGQPLDDLEQVAGVALVGAARAYDIGRGSDFLQYAIPCMRGAIQHSFRDSAWMIRPARSVQNRHLSMHEGPDAHVVTGIHITSCYQPLSLDVAPGPGQRTLGDLLPSDRDEFALADIRVWLEPSLAALPPRIRRLLHLRFVLQWTQEQIATDLGVSQMHVSRLLKRHLGALREQLTATP